MPNWCSTSIRITGKDAKAFYAFTEEAKKNAVIDTDFGASWLGHILQHAGMDRDEVISGCYHCRGWVEYDQCGEDDVTYWCESAWSPCVDVFEFVRDEMDFDVDIDYIAIEPGCGVYETSDYGYAGGDWYVDCDYDENSKFAPFIGEDNIWMKEDLEEALTEIYGRGSFDEMVKWANDEEDSYISITHIELVA